MPRDSHDCDTLQGGIHWLNLSYVGTRPCSTLNNYTEIIVALLPMQQIIISTPYSGSVARGMFSLVSVCVCVCLFVRQYDKS